MAARPAADPRCMDTCVSEAEEPVRVVWRYGYETTVATMGLAIGHESACWMLEVADSPPGRSASWALDERPSDDPGDMGTEFALDRDSPSTSSLDTVEFRLGMLTEVLDPGALRAWVVLGCLD